jgi:hypothetical protein
VSPAVDPKPQASRPSTFELISIEQAIRESGITVVYLENAAYRAA